ncbi:MULTISPECIES: glycosyltransferase [Olivibacter]|uniref:Glycosyltransferase n=1 Tax=Olivibacter jilunii TaxID=985016 RepID=A0ABW6B3T0_9SPHI|nr:glycosyltransferase [Olivibacter sp. UJ_SKK_5.1]MDX3915730.1 glycosyltransferase [Pseudosphingobacterium sp.]
MEQYLHLVLPALLSASLIIQLYHTFFVQGLLGRYPVDDLKRDTIYPPLSVIICARNEESNLRLYLSEVLEQDYPQFEVIVVNDGSSDDSNWVLKEFQARYPYLRTVEIRDQGRNRQGKKFAVTLGVKGAQYEHLVLTDADCFPQTDQWLKCMARQFRPSVEIVLGYSPYTRASGFLNKYVRFETYQTALNYLSNALRKNAYMGVGRNLAYTKSLFFKKKGFASHMHIPSGDDDLFVNQNATKSNVAICVAQEAHVWSTPKSTYKDYQRQKNRHFGAGKAYKGKHKLMLTFQAFNAVAFYLLIILILVLQPRFWPLAVSVYCFRLLCQLLVNIPIMKRLQVKDLIWWYPLMDLLHFIYISVMGVFALFRKNVQWK